MFFEKKVNYYKDQLNKILLIEDDEERNLRLESIHQTLRDNTVEQCINIGEVVEDFLPEEEGKMVPDEGCWVQVIYPPTTEVTVEHLSIWFVKPEVRKEAWDLVLKYHNNPYKIKLTTPAGEVMLYPHEYNLVSQDYLRTVLNSPADSGITVNWLDPRNDQFDVDKLFYILSRGVAKADAYLMLMGEVKSTNVCFITFHVEYQRIFAGVGVPTLSARSSVNAHIDNVERKKLYGEWY